MKILLISNMYPSENYPFYGIFVKNFKSELEQKGIDFEAVVIKGREISLIKKIQNYIKFCIETIKAVKKDNYDLIYVHYMGHSLIPLLFVTKFNKPLIINAHGSDVLADNKVGKFIQKLVKPVIKQANLIIVPSEYFKDIVCNKFKIEENKVFVSPSGGIDTKLFTPMDVKKDNLFTIGFVSRIDKGKGWDVFVKVIKILKDKGLSFKVIMIGDGKEKNDLLELISKLKLEEIINYLGAKSHNELPFYFNQMDIFIFPTRLAESLGLVGLEAMACGVPVIGSNVGGLSSYIQDGINGKLFELGNIEELAKNIEYFMSLKEADRQFYKINALQTAKNYDSDIVTKKLTVKLKEIIND